MPHVGKLGTLGFRVLSSPPAIAPELLERFRGLASSNVADAMGRFRYMDGGMQSRSGLALCGAAVTVLTRPADNLMVHKALEVARPGEVVVVCTCGNLTSAVFGELMCHTAVGAKVGGLVVDGAIRDVEAITRLGFPAYSRSVSPGSCDKDGPGEINVPISCGGTVVAPGDIVVGDGDGIAVVPRDVAEDVLILVGQIQSRERDRIEEIRAGQLFRGDVNESLRKKGAIA